MAQLKATPIKVYGKSVSNSKSMCRLCCGIYQPKYTKNLFHKANVELLGLAETIYGGKLPNEDCLPHLVCRPCERRLDNLKKFRKMVCENQNSMLQKKRCIEISPSALTTEGKRARTHGLEGKSSRRSLSFASNEEVEQSKVCSILYVMAESLCVFCEFKLLYKNCNVLDMSYLNTECP